MGGVRVTDKNFRDALSERLTQLNTDALDWSAKMQPYMGEAVEHLQPRIGMMASLVQMMPEAAALLALAPNQQAALQALLQVARAAFLMGYCSLIVAGEEEAVALTETGLSYLRGDDTQGG